MSAVIPNFLVQTSPLKTFTEDKPNPGVMTAKGAQHVYLVDANGDPISSLGGGSVTEYAEDDPHTTGDSGIMLLGVRNDSSVALVDTNMDYCPIATDSSGSVFVRLNGGNPGTTGGSLGKLEDAGHGTGHTGVFVLAVRQDAPANSAGTDADYCAFGVSADGGAWTTPTPSSSGGLSIFRSIDLDESEEEVKATAGTVYGMWVTNTSSSTRWLKFYNATAANVTVGSTTPVITIAIPGNAAGDDVSGNFGPGGMGIGFSTAITVAATTGVADADTGAPGANEVIVNIFYK